jgi:hypothetical protein
MTKRTGRIRQMENARTWRRDTSIAAIGILILSEAKDLPYGPGR